MINTTPKEDTTMFSVTLTITDRARKHGESSPTRVVAGAAAFASELTAPLAPLRSFLDSTST